MCYQLKKYKGGVIVKVVGTNLSMIRGDTESITVSLSDETGNKINFELGDTLYFTIKDNVNTVNKVMQKQITDFNEDGNAVIEILPSDTKELKYKEYVYDIQLTREDGTVTTIIPPSSFVIEGEVTYE
jgi:hypothetical protein